MALDPITVEVIHNYYLSAAREMERNLMRTAYNTIVYEIRDFGLGIYDRECRMLAESPGLAIFTCGNDYGIKKSVEFIGQDNFEPGDLVLTSYPYWASAHPLDVLAFSPIFYEQELIGFTAIKQHWLDLGQKEAGYMLDNTEVFQEGLIMPAMKLYRGRRAQRGNRQPHPLQQPHSGPRHRRYERADLRLPHRRAPRRPYGRALRRRYAAGGDRADSRSWRAHLARAPGRIAERQLGSGRLDRR